MTSAAGPVTPSLRRVTLHPRIDGDDGMKRWMIAGFAWLCLASLPAAACDRPTQFKATIGGFFGPSYAVELTPEGDLRYAHNPRTFVSDGPDTTRETVTVAPAAWTAFCRELDTAGAWQWKPSYVDGSVHDGTSWSFEITVDGKSMKSGGYNAWPGGSVSSPPAPGGDVSFSTWLHAVSTLVGGRAFH